MTDEELIARLRYLADLDADVGVMQDLYCGDDMCDAADRIEQLVATNETLIEQRAAARQDAEEAEAYAEELVKERDDYAHKLMQANNTYTEMHLEIERLSDKLATCEKYRDAYAECDRIGTQAVGDLEAKLAKAVELVEEAYSEGFAEGHDGGWIGGDYRKPWEKSAIFTTLAEIKGESHG